MAMLRLGFTSFGGPVAHIGYFRNDLVGKRRWLDEATFGELVALTSLLPGPSSSQLGIAIGTLRAGRLGGLAAWVGFTLPSAVIMAALAFGVGELDPDPGLLRGLGLAAAAVVVTALVGMTRTLAPDLRRAATAAGAAAVALAWSGSAGQIAAIAAAAVVGAIAMRETPIPGALEHRLPVGRRVALASITAFVALLAGLPLLRAIVGGHLIAMLDVFYRAGALVFGGGHVVLPLLSAGVVETGWVSSETFLAGYGLAQALPGPLFAFSAYLGAIQEPEPSGVAGALVALGAIFLPSFLLLGGVLPAWATLREHPHARAALTGVGAGVVGLVAAALWNPILTTTVEGAWDVAVILAGIVLLRMAPPWLVVAAAAAFGWLFL
jgi:chromate transporter